MVNLNSTENSGKTDKVSATIDSLWVYPVKSMKGVQLETCQLTPEGLAGDRQWMVIDEAGLFVSQRKLPAMELISVALTAAGVRLSHPEFGSIDVARSECRKIITASLWMTGVEAILAPRSVNQWLNKALSSKSTLSLVTLNPTYRRPLDSQRFGNHTTHFADAAPVLLANKESLSALNRSLKFTKQLPDFVMERFRPNIVIAGIPAFSEHQYHRMQFRGGRLKLIDHCQRCSIITVDPDTGQQQHTADTFTVLASLNAMPNKPKAPAFGVNCVVDHDHSCELNTGAAVNLSQS